MHSSIAVMSPRDTNRATLSPAAAHWDAEMGEFILDWDDVRVAADPFQTALDFGLTVIRHACNVCDWDPGLAGSAVGDSPPLV